MLGGGLRSPSAFLVYYTVLASYTTNVLMLNLTVKPHAVTQG